MLATLTGPSSAIVPASGFASAAEPKVWWSGEDGEPPAGGPAGPAGPPKLGGATPTIVPLRRLGEAAAAPAGGAPAPIGGASAVKPGPEAGAPAAAGGGAATAGDEPGRGGAPGIDPGWFIISIVPLNLGAAAVLSWKLHLAQVCAVSVF
jgi:hypothetical protein